MLSRALSLIRSPLPQNVTTNPPQRAPAKNLEFPSTPERPLSPSNPPKADQPQSANISHSGAFFRATLAAAQHRRSQELLDHGALLGWNAPQGRNRIALGVFDDMVLRQSTLRYQSN
jgi:hypothetical protein